MLCHLCAHLSRLPQKPILIQISQFQSPSEAKLTCFHTGLRVHWDSLYPSLWTLTSCQGRNHLALDTCGQRPPDLSQALTAQNLTHRLALAALSDFQAAVALRLAFSRPSCWARAVRWMWKACPGPGDCLHDVSGPCFPIFPGLSPPLLVSTCVGPRDSSYCTWPLYSAQGLKWGSFLPEGSLTVCVISKSQTAVEALRAHFQLLIQLWWLKYALPFATLGFCF